MPTTQLFGLSARQRPHAMSDTCRQHQLHIQYEASVWYWSVCVCMYYSHGAAFISVRHLQQFGDVVCLTAWWSCCILALLWLINTSTPALALLCSALHWIRYYKKHESRDDYLHIDKTFSDFNIPHIAAPIQFLSCYLVMRFGGDEHYICIVVHQSGIRSGVIFDQFWNFWFWINFSPFYLSDSTSFYKTAGQTFTVRMHVLPTVSKAPPQHLCFND